MKDKAWFISQYVQIHENLKSIQDEIDFHLENNKNRILIDDNTLEKLKDKAREGVERLEKTRLEEKKLLG